MAQVTRIECDQCGKTSALEKAGDWWNVQCSRREADPAHLSPMDQQLLQQAGAAMQTAPPGVNMPGGNMSVPGVTGFGAGAFPGAPMVPNPGPAIEAAPPFGSPRSVDVCSAKCALDFIRESTKEPTKAEKKAAGGANE